MRAAGRSSRSTSTPARRAEKAGGRAGRSKAEGSQSARHKPAQSDDTKSGGQSVLNREFSFKPVDFVAKPPLEDLFGLGGIQSGDRSARRIERNMVTRDIFALARLGDVLHENAFGARMSTRRIAEIQAGQRVLERRCGFTWRRNR